MRLSDERMAQQKSIAPRDELEVALIELLAGLGFHNKRIAALFDCNQGRISDYDSPPPPWSFEIKGVGKIVGGK
jgi:hypothetical protein